MLAVCEVFMADVEKFGKSPSHVSLNKCTKEQLVRIAEFYDIKINNKIFKESTIELKNKLIEKGILPIEMEHTEDVQAQSISALHF